ncbi:MAG: J domain-containing protein [Bryobacterales bacterium]|nr:J domain-containing protein [Bryobacterales bacterium]
MKVRDLQRDCRILGITPPASAAEVRQAYLDLVLVWHPDRFAANPRLQRKAAAKLVEINEAYEALRDGVAAPRFPAKRLFKPRRPFRLPFKPGSNWQLGLAAALIVTTFIAGTIWLLDTVPSVVAPLGTAERPPATQAFERALSDLTAGLRRTVPVPVSGEALQAGQTPSARLPSSPRKRSSPREMKDVGELIPRKGRPGSGVLHIRNETALDSAVTVAEQVQAHVPLRMAYVRAGGVARIAGIGPGVYVVQVQFGQGWRQSALAFSGNRSRVGPIGPFTFIQVQSERGIEASEYEIVLRPR